MVVDLNADLGEGCGQDKAILNYVSSANVACGFHAGDPSTMLQCVRWALERGVAVGAHPGYLDKSNFGRTYLNLPYEIVYAEVLYQIGALQAVVRSEGGKLHHVKPHGALYNQAARDIKLAETLVSAIRAADPSLKVVGLAGSVLIKSARDAGMHAVEEAFADRGYLSNGMLAPRENPGALIEDESLALSQTLMMIKQGEVIALDGSKVTIRADTICLHGDSEHAVNFAKLIRERLTFEGVNVSSF